jgi:proteasome lid subunit RPN8/RPN11
MGLLLGDVLVRAATPLAPDDSLDDSHCSTEPLTSFNTSWSCVGVLQHQDDGSATVRIWAAVPQIRTDRRKVSPSGFPDTASIAICGNLLVRQCLVKASSSHAQDRVEASPEQMARCSAKAERFSNETGTLTRVVGWYHSHPHITVLPSHVDVRTQAMYQMLDPGFIGLIISTFNEVCDHPLCQHVTIRVELHLQATCSEAMRPSSCAA